MFTRRDGADRLLASRAEIKAYLRKLADPAHRELYMRACNPHPMRIGNPDTCLIEPCTGVSVVITEATFANAGLGFRMFPSSLVLTAWLAKFKTAVSNRSILELGSGLGLPALVSSQVILPRCC
jgi:hypothetical protein